MTDVSQASLYELLHYASKKLAPSEVLILGELEDDPANTEACVIIGDKDYIYIPRRAIVAHRK